MLPPGLVFRALLDQAACLAYGNATPVAPRPDAAANYGDNGNYRKRSSLLDRAVTERTAFRYVRYLGPPNGFDNVAEVEFYGTSRLHSRGSD